MEPHLGLKIQADLGVGIYSAERVHRMSLELRVQELRSDATTSERLESILFSRTDRFEFTSDAGAVRTEVFTLARSPIRFGRGTSTGHVIELTEENQATFLIPTRGRLGVRVVGRDYNAEEGSMLSLHPHRRRSVVAPADDGRYAALVMMLPIAQFSTYSSSDGSRPFLGGRDGANLRSAEARRLQSYLGFMIGDILADPWQGPPERSARGMLALVEDLLRDLIAAGTDTVGPPPRVRAASAQRVRGAEELLRERADEPLSIAALADELGIGLRSLQLSFREVYGLTPRELLGRIRLERARERLLAGDPSAQVTTVALDCGFTHLSRFAGAYHRAFGERSSETLRRRRA